MRMYDLIQKKKQGQALTKEEIRFFITRLVAGKIPDYQTSALLMAIWFNGMQPEELVDFTIAMADSGDRVDLSALPGITADKHSTGGVGDKTTLLVAPMAAACGLTVAKMSGRGLGHTGGTIDKLESIPGFRTGLSREEFFSAVSAHGLAVVGQTGNLAPADKILYALRDVTATVDSLPLIASSIMSKKLAAGASCILLDVKVGSGAFLKTREEAAQLASTMVAIGEQAGRRCGALLTNMDRPLGCAVGNSLEVREAAAALLGHGPADLLLVSKALAAQMLVLAGKGDRDQCMTLVEHSLANGSAWQKLRDMTAAQGGDPDALESLPAAPCRKTLRAPASGWISAMDTEQIGIASMLLGAGRRKKEDPVDYGAGLVLHKKTGDRVEQGQVLADLYCSDPALFPDAEACFLQALTLSEAPFDPGPALLGLVERDGSVHWSKQVTESV